MVKPACFDSKGMKKGAWSEEEDEKLRAYVMRYGHWNWRLLPKYAGLARCGKSCRLRWMNHLKPGIKRGNFTKQEEELIIQLHAQLGNKWSAIATKLPGRTDHEIKNFWYNTRVKRRANKRNDEQTTTVHIQEPYDLIINRQTVITSPNFETDTNDLVDVLDYESISSLNSPENSSQSTADIDSMRNGILLQNDIYSWDSMDWNELLSLADSVDQTQNNRVFPKLPLQDSNFNFQAQIQDPNEFSSWDSSRSTSSDWIAYDPGFTSSDSVAESIAKQSFWNDLFVNDNYCQSDDIISRSSLTNFDDGGFYDPCYKYFDNAVDLF